MALEMPVNRMAQGHIRTVSRGRVTHEFKET